jgi:hypothetical protein
MRRDEKEEEGDHRGLELFIVVAPQPPPHS